MEVLTTVRVNRRNRVVIASFYMEQGAVVKVNNAFWEPHKI